VAVVNETLARRFWPDTRAVGHRLRPAMAGAPWFTVVGVVRDTRQGGLTAPPGSELFVTHRQSRRLLSGWMPLAMNLVVRGSTGELDAIAQALRADVRRLEPAAAISGIAKMSEVVARTAGQPRLMASVLTAFAGIAVLLATVGVYGVTSFNVGTRTGEFGVRMALGASTHAVVRQVMRSALLPITAGLGAGLAGALAAARLLAGQLFGVPPLDPVSLAAAMGVIAAAAVAATFVPAVRAARLDPLAALRQP
jgi:hypothetical protein